MTKLNVKTPVGQKTSKLLQRMFNRLRPTKRYKTVYSNKRQHIQIQIQTQTQHHITKYNITAQNNIYQYKATRKKLEQHKQTQHIRKLYENVYQLKKHNRTCNTSKRT